jgi:hypothetical protein
MQRADHCEKVVRRIAQDADNIKFGLHAFDRSLERDISTLDAIDVLRTGHLSPEIKPGKGPNEWVCKVVKAIHPHRPDVGVVTVVMQESKLLVITVEWEFPK